MVPIKTYKSYWDQIAALVGFDIVMLVSDESELQELIDNVGDSQTILVAVIPSGDSQAPDADNIEEIDHCFLFVLQKITASNLTREELIDVKALTQERLTRVKEYMHADHLNVSEDSERSVLMRRLVLDKMHTDPESNYLGCTGWSLSFQLKSTWYDHS